MVEIHLNLITYFQLVGNVASILIFSLPSLGAWQNLWIAL